MKFLLDLLQSKGAVILSETVDGDLWENEGKLLEAHQADAIVNASGLGARELASDSTVHPARGGLLRLVNDGKVFEKVTFATVVNKAEKTDFSKLKKKQKKEGKDKEDCDIVFIVPRNDDILILGTFLELDEWTTDLTVESPIMRMMREKCEKFMPALRNARLDPEYPIAQGLRPLRKVMRELNVNRE